MNNGHPIEKQITFETAQAIREAYQNGMPMRNTGDGSIGTNCLQAKFGLNKDTIARILNWDIFRTDGKRRKKNGEWEEVKKAPAPPEPPKVAAQVAWDGQPLREPPKRITPERIERIKELSLQTKPRLSHQQIGELVGLTAFTVARYAAEAADLEKQKRREVERARQAVYNQD